MYKMLGLAALMSLACLTFAQNGEQLYSQQGCSGCHGANGKGGIGPALAGDQNLKKASNAYNQILHGGGGMPAYNQLSNAQIAALSTYIRTSWGNNFGKVTAQQVAQQRSGSSSSGSSSSGGGNAASGDGQNEQKFQGQASGGAGSGGSASGGAGSANSQASQAPAQPSTQAPTQQELTNAAKSTDSWLMYNKGYNGQRYSSLKQINTQNVGNLQVKCILQLGEAGASFQTSPVVYGGLIYLTTNHNTYAADAKNCREVWSYAYTPQDPEPFPVNRGVAIAGGRVFRGTPDGHLLALDAKTGDLLWNIRPVSSAAGYFLSSAPIVWHDLVFTGTAGADWGANGQMFAFDVKSGKQVWSFSEIVPKTFGSADAAATGGGSNWTSYTLDSATGMLYVPVGNPAPDFSAQSRPGKNLYTNSVIVLNAKSGKLERYYQQIPNDSHDWDTAAAPVIFSQQALGSNAASGDTYMAVANKGGYLYVYNEQTQKLVYKVKTTTIKNADQAPTAKGVRVCPGITGGAEWYGPTYDPENNALFVNSVDWCTTYKLGEIRYSKGELFFGGPYIPDPVSKASGWLHAYDAASGKVLWRYHAKRPLIAALTPTAGGLIFTGELNGDFVALEAKTGKVRYSFNTGGPIGAGISTYELDGQQYLAVASGNGASRSWSPDAGAAATLLLFTLPQGQ